MLHVNYMKSFTYSNAVVKVDFNVVWNMKRFLKQRLHCLQSLYSNFRYTKLYVLHVLKRENYFCTLRSTVLFEKFTNVIYEYKMDDLNKKQWYFHVSVVWIWVQILEVIKKSHSRFGSFDMNTILKCAYMCVCTLYKR